MFKGDRKRDRRATPRIEGLEDRKVPTVGISRVGDVLRIDGTAGRDAITVTYGEQAGLPFLTEPGELLDAVAASIQAVTGRQTTPSTSGGTSDGRFIATLGTQVVELGPVNATIHQVNERVLASDLDLLSEIYYQTLVRLLA